jgi:hypothetical protein
MMVEFPTENQRFLVQTTTGALVGQVTAKGLNLAVVNKVNNPRATSSLFSSSPMLENGIKPMQITHSGQFSSQITHRTVQEVLGDHTIIKGSKRELAALEIKTILQQDGKIMAGVGNKRSIDDINRLTATYGGKKEDWVKKTTINLNQRSLVNKTQKVELHWYENLKNGVKVEPKIKKVD